MLSRLISRAKTAFLQVKAFDSSAKGQFDEALRRIEAIERLDPSVTGPPLLEFGLEVQLLKALSLCHLGRYQEALILVKQLHTTLRTKKSAASRYLVGYLSELCNFALSNSGVTIVPQEFLELATVDLSSISLDLVPSRLKRRFPLPTHPDWQSRSETT